MSSREAGRFQASRCSRRPFESSGSTCALSRNPVPSMQIGCPAPIWDVDPSWADWQCSQYPWAISVIPVSHSSSCAIPNSALQPPAPACKIAQKRYISISSFRPNELASGAKAASLTTFSKTRYRTGGALARPLVFPLKADNAHGHRNCEVV
jgi:hypothetical protein